MPTNSEGPDDDPIDNNAELTEDATALPDDEVAIELPVEPGDADAQPI